MYLYTPALTCILLHTSRAMALVVCSVLSSDGWTSSVLSVNDDVKRFQIQMRSPWPLASGQCLRNNGADVIGHGRTSTNARNSIDPSAHGDFSRKEASEGRGKTLVHSLTLLVTRSLSALALLSSYTPGASLWQREKGTSCSTERSGKKCTSKKHGRHIENVGEENGRENKGKQKRKTEKKKRKKERKAHRV